MTKLIKPKARLKTPISYYGGKQAMLKHILPIIPKHNIYIEPFFGGGAVFWAKERVKVEIVNDYNENVVNFYRVLKSNYEQLKFAIDETLYSRATYRRALLIYESPFMFGEVQRAWAFWVCCIQGFSNKIGSWRGANNRNKEAVLNFNKKRQLTPNFSERLSDTTVECNDAVAIIQRHDAVDAFFYIDPPYVGANQGHYGGYTQEHFETLLETLCGIKGKFLLSSYPNDILDALRQEHGWYSSDKDMALSASANNARRKTEALTANYPI